MNHDSFAAAHRKELSESALAGIRSLLTACSSCLSSPGSSAFYARSWMLVKSTVRVVECTWANEVCSTSCLFMMPLGIGNRDRRGAVRCELFGAGKKHTHTQIQRYIHIHVHIHIHIIHIHIHIYMYIYIYTFIHMRIYIYICVCAYLCLHICIYVYTYVCSIEDTCI